MTQDRHAIDQAVDRAIRRVTNGHEVLELKLALLRGLETFIQTNRRKPGITKD